MPRRPRPASRRPPHEVLASKQISSSSTASKHNASASKNPRIQEVEAESSSLEEEDEDDEQESKASSSGSDGAYDENEDVEDVDVDAPRVAQWVDEEALGDQSEEDSGIEDSDAEAEEPSPLTISQQNDLASLPFGALRKAQRQLAQARTLDDSDDPSSDADNAELEPAVAHTDVKGKGKEKEFPNTKPEIPKRKNKHAPTEVTSKRPVPRKRLPEGEKIVSRDPRFLDLAGEFSAQKFNSQYDFLSDMHKDEMKTLRDNLKRARKLLVSSPRDLREEREQEVQRLERAVKRAESTVNKDRREKIEQEALHDVAKSEREKRKDGKGAWYMKDSDKKQLLLRAKFEALAAAGGKGAVKKAIEKKQKKVGQKEKKQRPFAPGEFGRGHRPGKRAQPGSGDDNQRKRRRVD